MWLLSTDRAELYYFSSPERVPGGYAILSHTWGRKEGEGDEEVESEQTFQRTLALALQGAATGTNPRDLANWKVRKSCTLAEECGYRWIWIDTCCIDKTNSGEHSEAINSMFRWYSLAEVCFVYMVDVDSNSSGDQRIRKQKDPFRKARWHFRGWTLQELIAPSHVVFVYSNWSIKGNKVELAPLLQEITGIPSRVLTGEMHYSLCSIAERMSWASTRKTECLEDEAYCLMGLFNVNMPTIYGEGGRAFQRLQYEIVKQSFDTSLFVWGHPTHSPQATTTPNRSPQTITMPNHSRQTRATTTSPKTPSTPTRSSKKPATHTRSPPLERKGRFSTATPSSPTGKASIVPTSSPKAALAMHTTSPGAPARSTRSLSLKTFFSTPRSPKVSPAPNSSSEDSDIDSICSPMVAPVPLERQEFDGVLNTTSQSHMYLFADSPKRFFRPWQKTVHFTPTAREPLQPDIDWQQKKTCPTRDEFKSEPDTNDRNPSPTLPFGGIELPKFSVTNYGLKCRLPIIESDGLTVAVLLCENSDNYIGLLLHPSNDTIQDPSRKKYNTGSAYRTVGYEDGFARLTSLGNDLFDLRINKKKVDVEWRDFYIATGPPPIEQDVPSRICAALHSIAPAPPFRVPTWLINQMALVGMGLQKLDVEDCSEDGPNPLSVSFKLIFEDIDAKESIHLFLGVCAARPGHQSHWAKAVSQFSSNWRKKTDSSHDCSEHHVAKWEGGKKDFGDAARTVWLSFKKCKLAPKHTRVICLALEGTSYTGWKTLKHNCGIKQCHANGQSDSPRMQSKPTSGSTRPKDSKGCNGSYDPPMAEEDPFR